MMKSSKSAHKLHKPSRISPIRKDHMMKKPIHPSSSMHMSISSRPPPMKHRLSPGMKRSPIIPPGKSMHPPRMRPIASPPHRSLPRHSHQGSPPVPMDRGHPMKYEKRRHSPSPIRHPMASTPHPNRAPSPYQDERYTGRPMTRQSRFSSPVKKKGRRDSDDSYLRPTSPGVHMMQRSEMPHAVGRIPPHAGVLLPTPEASGIIKQTQRNHSPLLQHDRREHYDMQSRDNHSTLPALSSGHAKRPLPAPMKQRRMESPDYDGQELKLYWAGKEKHYSPPTLSERFGAVSDEPRIKYTREDLEKITIDVHRGLNSPPRRHILDPGPLKLLPKAGLRRMFDRDEIKQSPRDMREEAYFEKRPLDDGLPRYEVSRQKFESAPMSQLRGRSPGDRWQREEAVAADGASMDRDHREYEKTAKKRFVDTRSKSGDQDFRSGKYSRDASRERPEYHDIQHRMPSPEHRSNIPIHHKEPIQDARERLTARRGSAIKPQSSRSDPRGRYPSESEKHYFEDPRTDKHYKDHPSPEAHKWAQKHRSDSRERMPEYSRPTEKYRQKSWPEKRDLSPRNSDHYYETGRYAESESYRGRGGSRPFRSREQRGRGSFPSRSFRGGYRGSTPGRGRGAPRSGRYSPGWDEFYSRSPDGR